MSEAKGIIKNAGLLFAADLASKFLSFFLVVAIARYLGDAGLGKYSFAFAFAGLFAIFADLGLSTYLTREIARDKEKAARYASNMLMLKLILAAFTLLPPLVVINFIEQSPEVRQAVYIVALATAFLNLNNVFSTLFASHEKLEYTALATILERILTVGLGLLLLFAGKGLIGLVTAYLVSYLIVLVVSGIIAYKKTSAFSLGFDRELWKHMLKSSLPFWFTTIFITIYFRIDTVLLQMMTSYQQVGWYNAAYKALDALYFIPSAVVTATFPVMSRLHDSNKELLQKLYKRAFYYLVVLAIPIATGIMLLSDRIIKFIYGSGFEQAAPALQILIWAEAMIFISTLAGYLLNSINRQLVFTYTAAAATLLNIGANLILIPKYGYMGAAIATVLTEAMVLIVLYHSAKTNGYGADLTKSFLKPTIAALAMAATLLLLDFMPILVLIPIGAAAYFAVLFLIRGIGKDEISIVREIKESVMK